MSEMSSITPKYKGVERSGFVKGFTKYKHLNKKEFDIDEMQKAVYLALKGLSFGEIIRKLRTLTAEATVTEKEILILKIEK